MTVNIGLVMVNIHLPFDICTTLTSTELQMMGEGTHSFHGIWSGS
jgi:hypothetical protein